MQDILHTPVYCINAISAVISTSAG